ncbi:hypothetical protein ISN44_Un127g000010, partial [Arabidopsis suecica]
SKGDIVLNVASSGIASLLLEGGRTAHSRFGIPLTPNEFATCNMKAGSDRANLVKEAFLIIWDEAPMMSRHCFESLDRSLSDICGNGDNKPFGGKVVVFGNDFRQVLPVIPGADRADIVMYALNSSYLWIHCKVLTLTKNMRLYSEGLSVSEAKDIKEFSEWKLAVGDGEEFTFLSLDSLDPADIGGKNNPALTPDFLNSVKFSGLPNHKLRLKIGCPMMLLRNIDPIGGHMNGTRLRITQMGPFILQAMILTGRPIVPLLFRRTRLYLGKQRISLSTKERWLRILPGKDASDVKETRSRSGRFGRGRNFPTMRFGGRILYNKTTIEVDKRGLQLLKDMAAQIKDFQSKPRPPSPTPKVRRSGSTSSAARRADKIDQPRASSFDPRKVISELREPRRRQRRASKRSTTYSTGHDEQNPPTSTSPTTRPQKSPPQTIQTPTPARSHSQSGSQQPPLIRRKQQQPLACQHQIPYLQEQPSQDPPETQFIPNHQNPNNHEEEDEEDDGEEDGDEFREEDGEEVDEEEQNPNVDYQELLDRLLALPGRQHLMILSQEPIP